MLVGAATPARAGAADAFRNAQEIVEQACEALAAAERAIERRHGAGVARIVVIDPGAHHRGEQHGEALRPQQGFPVRIIPPGFEGIFHTKYLRRIKIVDRYYMNYNDFGHLDKEAEEAALGFQIGPKSVITYPSGGQQLPGPGFYEIRGLAWSGGGAIRTVEVSTDGGRKWNRAEIKGTAQRMAHTRFGYEWNWDGNETEILSRCTDEIGQVQPTREQVAKYWNVPFERNYRVPGLDNSVMPWRIARDGSVTNGLA